ncbi:unnamed protein product [Peniophora sp. CBMAI 1063]|nr:unnamed protein product [Peniophora sp. CBMAI 1063]
MSSNSSLSAADGATLKTIGEDTIRYVVFLVVEAIFYTIYFILVVFSGRVLLSKKRRSKITVAIFAIILSMLVLDTALCILDVNSVIQELRDTLTTDSTDPLPVRYANRYSSWAVGNAPFAFMYNLGDVIIVWRTYAFYYHSPERWLLVLPTALLAGSFIVTGIICYCIAHGAVSTVNNFIDPPLCVHIQITSYAIAFATTAVATFMICWKTWTYRRLVRHDSQAATQKTRAEKILIILIESGLVYLIFFFFVLLDDVGDVPSLETSTPALVFSTEIWTYTTSEIIGIYPVIIVLLVHSQRSYIDDVVMSTIGIIPTHSIIKFAAPPSNKDGAAVTSVRHEGRDSHVLHIDVHELQERHEGASFNDGSEGMTNGELEFHKSREKLRLPSESGEAVIAIE